MSDFESFWLAYPRKIGKLAAKKAWERACRLATADAILAGLERYRAHMPDDPQFRPHPATWLNQGRWDDDYQHETAPRVGTRTAALQRASEDFLRGFSEPKGKRLESH